MHNVEVRGEGKRSLTESSAEGATSTAGLAVAATTEKKMNVIEIVKAGLETGGFDGLYCPHGPCGCLATDLAPCDNLPRDCKPGYKQTRSDGEWIVAGQKGPMSDDEISTILDDC